MFMVGSVMDSPSSTQITECLLRWSEGDNSALNELIPLVYDHLRRMARFQLFNERDGHTLQPTALVHEAYIKLARQPKVEWHNRLHFMAVAAHAMRQILIDHARKRNRKKGPGKFVILPLDEVLVYAPEKSSSLLALDEALEKLSQEAPRKARVVELRVFGGLSNADIATVLGISENTVLRDWGFATSRLMALIRNGNPHDRGTTKKD